jgi:hypothetical protein
MRRMETMRSQMSWASWERICWLMNLRRHVRMNGIRWEKGGGLLLSADADAVRRVDGVCECAFEFRVCAFFFGWRVVGVDSQTAFFIDVGVAHGYYDGVDGDVHHYYVEELEAYTEGGDGDDLALFCQLIGLIELRGWTYIESTRANRECLE